jgi:methylated-DNA-[protein]-cysteine S-methyltransferase
MPRNTVAAKSISSLSDQNNSHQAYAFSTALGWMILAWREEKLTRLSFGFPSLPSAVREFTKLLTDAPVQVVPETELPRWLRSLSKQLARLAEGQVIDFSAIPLELGKQTSFQRQVLEHCRRIPAGCTKSYAELAALAGSPRAARAVGNVMRSNRFPLLIPCHRVIGSNGQLCGFTSPQGLTMKERLLQLERAMQLNA